MSDIKNFIAKPQLLKNRVVLITGAYGGLGSAISKRCGALGATVILLGRSIPKLEQLYDELESNGAPEPGIYPLDLEGASPKDYDDLAETIKREFGQLNALVHCAAAFGTPTPLQAYPMEQWGKVLATNLHGPIMLTQACLPVLDKSKLASVVFTLDDHNTAYWGAYGVSKAALRTAAEILADETENLINDEGLTSVAVNMFNPGRMRTRLRAKAFPGELPEENPFPDEKINALLYLLARVDPSLTGSIVELE